MILPYSQRNGVNLRQIEQGPITIDATGPYCFRIGKSDQLFMLSQKVFTFLKKPEDSGLFSSDSFSNSFRSSF